MIFAKNFNSRSNNYIIHNYHPTLTPYIRTIIYAHVVPNFHPMPYFVQHARADNR